MLIGEANIDELAAAAPTIEAFHPEPITLGDVAVFQMTVEMHREAGARALPSGLHPTLPASLSLQAYDVGDSPFGAFAFATARVSCRSGVRARGFTTGAFASTEAGVRGLRETLGFPCRLGEVDLKRHFDGVDLAVRAEGGEVLAVRALDPDPMGLDDVQFTGTMNLARTPKGLRLVQVESRPQLNRVERMATAALLRFDAAAWGDAVLDPYHVVASAVALGEMEIPAVRFVCKPEELAFTGTEPVD